MGPTWIDSVAGYAPSTNPLTGERCVNELTDRKRYCDVIFEVGEPLIQVTSDANVPDWSRPSPRMLPGAFVTSLHVLCGTGQSVLVLM